jgi:hypothetical protein
MRLLKVMIISLLLMACDESTKREWFPPAQDRVQSLSYVKDNRTGLCFTYMSVTNSNGFSSDVFSNVPCTPEVEKLIQK